MWKGSLVTNIKSYAYTSQLIFQIFQITGITCNLLGFTIRAECPESIERPYMCNSVQLIVCVTYAINEVPSMHVQ